MKIITDVCDQTSGQTGYYKVTNERYGYIIQPITLWVNLTGQVMWKIQPLKVKHDYRNAKRVGN